MSGQPRRDFHARLKAAVETLDSTSRIEELARLTETSLTYIETIQVDRALRGLGEAAATSHVNVRLAALGATTIDHLFPAIRVAGLRRQLLVEIRAGRFGQYRQELLAADPAIAAFRPSVVLLSVTSRDVLGDVPLTASRDAAKHIVADAVGTLRELWRRARERLGAVVVQQSFLDVSPALLGNHDRLVPGSAQSLVAALNAAVAEAAADAGTLLLDVAAASARDGLDAWFDERHWLQGKIEIAPAAASRYGELLARLLGAHFGRSRKCLVLDLDNTLWGGVLGDDGLEGVKLGQGSALGEAHLAVQKFAKQLADRGVVLAVCSKNEWSLVEEMFDRHPEMHLRRSDIAAFAVDWKDKAESLRSLAQRLNLGLDSFVFVDDNPVERARVRESLPMVAVPELPDDPAHYVREIAAAGYFEATVITDEDKGRAAQYAADIEREALRDSMSLDDFLRGLKMSVTSGPITSTDLPRAAQLINKTSQFNTTTRRLRAEEVDAWTHDPDGLALQFRLVDRFGDNGLVSVMLFRHRTDGPAELELVSWVMSCRVFGRQLEHESLNIAVEAARSRGARAIVADYVPTRKNAVIKDLFANLGFRRVEDGSSSERTRWALDLTRYEPHETHIARTAKS